jgi:uncharacterized membrane protein
LRTSSLVSPLRALTARRGGLWAVVSGVTVWLLLNVFASNFLPVARILIAWDIGVCVYLTSVFWLLHDATPAKMAEHSAQHRIGRHFVLLISIAALVVSLAVLVFEIRAISGEPDDMQGMRVAFVLATVALSWLFINTSFATHYAFEYYAARNDGKGKRGGLEFPNGQEPDFWDVWNFSVALGLCFATADINITSRSIRRITTVHGICAFLFNTVLLAATVSFAGAFLRPEG